MRAIAAVLGLALASCAPPTRVAKTEFKGFVLGEPLNLLQAQQELKLRCVPPTGKTDTVLCMGSTTIAAVPSEVLLDVTPDGRLASATLNLKAAHRAAVEEALRDKFGRPSTTRSSPGLEWMEWIQADDSLVSLSAMDSSFSVTFKSAAQRRIDSPKDFDPKKDL